MIQRLLQPPKRSFFLLGPRMTGKSTWLKKHYPDAHFIDLLSEANYQRYLSRPTALAEELAAIEARTKSAWVVIDEIQRIPSLLNEVHAAIERKKLKFALSGSSARKLKRGSANLLAGRAIELRLFPLTSVELDQNSPPPPSIDPILHYGCLPSVITESDPREKVRTLRSYAATYVREEIQAEGLTRNLPAFSQFLRLAGEAFAQETNFTQISRETTVKANTIRGYYEILEDTLLGFSLPPWERSVRKELAGSPKFYFFDCGVTNALRETLEDAPTGDIKARLLEQWVIAEIRALLSYQESEIRLNYWRARGGREVDLVLSRGNQPIIALEIKSTRNPSNRDFASLVSFAEEYPKVPLILLTAQPRPTLHTIHGYQVRAMNPFSFMKELVAGTAW